MSNTDNGALGNQAYDALKSALMAGQLAPGERVVMRQVAASFGMSLTPVRDAINRLMAERVLEHGGLGQSGGARVPLVDAAQFQQLMMVRASLEPDVAAAAAGVATSAELDAVEAQLKLMQDAVRRGEVARYFEAHWRFHFGIYALARMPVVMEIVEGIWLRSAPTLTLASHGSRPSLRRFPMHTQAVAALRAGDAAGVAQAIRSDIDSARRDIGALLPVR